MFVYCSLGCVFLVLAEEFIPNSVSWQLLCNSVLWWQQIQIARRIWGYQSSACLSHVLSGAGSEQLPSEGAGSGFAVGQPCPEHAAAPRQEAALGAVCALLGSDPLLGSEPAVPAAAHGCRVRAQQNELQEESCARVCDFTAIWKLHTVPNGCQFRVDGNAAICVLFAWCGCRCTSQLLGVFILCFTRMILCM